ncbi:MAG: SIS domain-containing protein [Promethearchaeota archaeon]
MDYSSIIEDLNRIPKELLECLRYYKSEEGNNLLVLFKKVIIAKNIKKLVFIGHSYNYFASFSPYYYINSYLTRYYKKYKYSCSIFEVNSFLMNLESNKVCPDSIYIFISKMGRSPQIIEAINKLKEIGIQEELILGVTNELDSPLANQTFITFPLKISKEEVIGTKSYVNLLLVLVFLSKTLSQCMGIDRKDYMAEVMNDRPTHKDDFIIDAELEKEIRELIFEMKFYNQDWEYHTQNFTNFLGEDYKFLYFISKGASLSTVYQSAQNCKAYARTFGEGISIGLFLHGPFQIVDKDFRCIIIIGDESSLDYTIELINLITKRLGEGKVVLINNSRKLSSLGRANSNVFVFEHTTKNSYLAPIFEIMVVNYIILERAKNKGVVS